MEITNLLYLKYFYDAVRLKSISKSASSNHVTQSAVSQGIVKLERIIGHPLLVHRPKIFQVTPKGFLLFERARTIFKHFDDLTDEMTEKDDERRGAVRFSCLHSLALSTLSPVLKTFQDAYPQVCLELHLGHKTKAKDLLRTGEIDFGMVIDPEDIDEFEKELLYTGLYRLYVGTSVKPHQYKNLGFLLSEEGRPTTFLREEYANHFGKPIQTKIQIESWEMLAQLAEEGAGIVYLPDYVAASHRFSLREYKLALPPLNYYVYAISHKGVPQTRLSQRLISLVKSSHKPNVRNCSA